MQRNATRVALGALVVAVVAAGVALRFTTRSDLWLDEALNVNVARLPLGEITDALRHDGFPPLWYWLLHMWTGVFGEGDTAVRSLSGVLSVATLPLAWAAGRRLGGERGGWAALLLLASSPFAIRYATEARMYSLLGLLAVLGFLAVARALERPSAGRLVAVAAVTAALVLVHYWALFLVAATVAGLAWRAVRRREGAAARALVAVGVGGLALVPWLGVLRYQLEHTGTPWAKGTQPLSALTATVAAWGGGLGVLARVLGVVLVGLAAWGVLRRPQARTLAAVTAGALLFGLAVVTASRSAFQPRYSAVVLTLVVLLAAVGLTRVPDARVATALLVVVVVGGLVAGVRWVRVDRTQAGEAAAAIEAGLGPDDVVAYCPDQLGPGVSRLLSPDVAQEPYPLGGDPRFVDWVDYQDRNEAADPEAFAADLLRTADEAGGRLWYVWTPGYRTLGTACESMVQLLKGSGRVATTVVDRRSDVDEDAEVIRYDLPA